MMPCQSACQAELTGCLPKIKNRDEADGSYWNVESSKVAQKVSQQNSDQFAEDVEIVDRVGRRDSIGWTDDLNG